MAQKVSATMQDLKNATKYANDRYLKQLCLKEKQNFPGIEWKPMDEYRSYSCPATLVENGSCEYGKCLIVTEQECMNQSQVKITQKGDALPTNPCEKDDDCTGLTYDAICNTGIKSCVPKKPYLEWRPGENGKDGKCVFGNSGLRTWCEFPKTRSDKSENGITNVPPFRYDTNLGTCHITKDYCKWMGVDYRTSGEYSGDCKISPGQYIGEMMFGKTFFRQGKKMAEGTVSPIPGVKKSDVNFFENFTTSPKIDKTGLFSFFNDIPEVVTKLADKKLMSKYAPLVNNYGGDGIHLYEILWAYNACDFDNNAKLRTVGFVADEIYNIYPEIIKNKNGYNFIVVSKTQIKINPKLKRIYVISGSGNWMYNVFVKSAQQQK